MSPIENVSRRRFLQGMFGAGALVLAARYIPPMLRHSHLTDGQTDADLATFHPNLFVGIQRDGTVSIVAHRSEMGTTIRTSLPLVLADELDADWKRVKINQAIGDKRYGDQNTDGSHSIRSFFDTLRECGAAARLMLIQAAAEQWKVAVSECSTEMHTVVHKASGRRVGYGELASAAARLVAPKTEQLKLKEPSEWRYIGKGMTSVDLEDLCTGRAMYGMDARADNMVYASIEHPPVFGGKIRTLDDQETLKVAGV
ncbi:MAG TPA: molybdopterin cofactor-binding domain-containing protein, partial [Candidatus Acidoferrum sp.]|nr:molybdopterin cofactor-binding domain-containing protein [Candidatus Acidoferrum sp.]